MREVGERLTLEEMVRKKEEVDGRRSDQVYLDALDGERGVARKWKNLVPNASDRVLLRRFMMGGIPCVKTNLAKRAKQCALGTSG